jgi:hypothetical protein
VYVLYQQHRGCANSLPLDGGEAAMNDIIDLIQSQKLVKILSKKRTSTSFSRKVAI